MVDPPRGGFKGTVTAKFQRSKVSELLRVLETWLCFIAWSEVSAAGADLEVFLQGSDLDGAVASVGVEVEAYRRRHIGCAVRLLWRRTSA